MTTYMWAIPEKLKVRVPFITGIREFILVPALVVVHSESLSAESGSESEASNKPRVTLFLVWQWQCFAFPSLLLIVVGQGPYFDDNQAQLTVLHLPMTFNIFWDCAALATT